MKVRETNYLLSIAMTCRLASFSPRMHLFELIPGMCHVHASISNCSVYQRMSNFVGVYYNTINEWYHYVILA